MTYLGVSGNRSRSVTHLGYEFQAETCRLGLIKFAGSDKLHIRRPDGSGRAPVPGAATCGSGRASPKKESGGFASPPLPREGVFCFYRFASQIVSVDEPQ
jgi:hypothetical protein